MRISDWSSDVCSSDLIWLVQLRNDAAGALGVFALADPRHAVNGLSCANERFDRRRWRIGRVVQHQIATKLGIVSDHPPEGLRFPQCLQIGRAACRERVVRDVYVLEVGGTTKKKN